MEGLQIRHAQAVETQYVREALGQHDERARYEAATHAGPLVVERARSAEPPFEPRLTVDGILRAGRSFKQSAREMFGVNRYE